MLGRLGRFMFKKIGGRAIGKVTRWGLFSLMLFCGPGPIVAAVGVEGLILSSAVIYSGAIEYTGEKIAQRL